MVSFLLMTSWSGDTQFTHLCKAARSVPRLSSPCAACLVLPCEEALPCPQCVVLRYTWKGHDSSQQHHGRSVFLNNVHISEAAESCEHQQALPLQLLVSILILVER